jgi:hypothetical protein
MAGRLKDWTLDRVKIIGNGLGGWEGDLDGDFSGNSGTIHFRHLQVEWNGCGETFPGLQPTGCWGQTSGGYGDGMATAVTAGHWIIEDSIIRHNTQDGIDLLYVRLPGSQIEIRRTLVEGNAGNQIKTTGPVTIDNSIVVGNCRFFQDKPYTSNWDDDCRAGGDAVATILRPGDQASLTHNTITGEGTCLMISGCALNQVCNGSEIVRLRNNIFQGRSPESGDPTCFAWYNDESGDTLPASPYDTDYSIIHGTRFGNVTPTCTGAHNSCNLAPGLVNTSINTFDAHPTAGSPAIDAASGLFTTAYDFGGAGRPFGSAPDIGAYEYR